MEENDHEAYAREPPLYSFTPKSCVSENDRSEEDSVILLSSESSGVQHRGAETEDNVVPVPSGMSEDAIQKVLPNDSVVLLSSGMSEEGLPEGMIEMIERMEEEGNVMYQVPAVAIGLTW